MVFVYLDERFIGFEYTNAGRTIELKGLPKNGYILKAARRLKRRTRATHAYVVSGRETESGMSLVLQPIKIISADHKLKQAKH